MKILVRKIFIEKDANGKNRLKKKISIFLFCLISASLFWLLNALSKDLTLGIEYNCIYQHSDSSFAITNQPPKKIKVYTYGSGFNLIGEALFWNKKELRIDVDESNLDRDGNQIIPTKTLVNEISNQLGSNISVESIYPEFLTIHMQPLQRKKVAVKLRHELSFAPQIRLKDSIVSQPQFVEIFGPSDQLDSIRYVTTELIKENDIKSDFKTVAKLESNLGPYIRTFPSSVEVEVKTERFTEKTIELPIKVINLPDEVRLRTLPAAVEIKVLVSNSMFELLKADDFIAFVDYDQANKEISKLKVSVKQEGVDVEIIKVSPEKVEYLIKK
ncbi:hypothetical protein GYB57_05085 [bacterium]|nr:hypothetical protein [bacterium]